MPCGKNNNLIPCSERSKEQLSEMGRKGQPRAAKKRVENRNFREGITAGLKARLPEGVVDERTQAVIDAIVKKGKAASVQDGIIAALYAIVLSGEGRAVEAAKLILDQAGEGVPEKQEIRIVANTPDVEAYMR